METQPLTAKKNTPVETQPLTEKKKSPVKWIVIGLVAAIALFFGIRYWIVNSHYESTDNAQLDATIIPVRSSVQGYVRQVLFEDNKAVKKGQLLLSIDDVDPKARQAQAEAALQNAKANLQALRSSARGGQQSAQASALSSQSVRFGIQSAQARQSQAQEDLNRVQNLFKEGAATRAQLEASQTALDVAKAQTAAATSQYQSSAAQSGGAFSQAASQVSQVSLAEAMVRQREAELILANTQLGYTQVQAPANGIVSKKAVDPGQYIQIGRPICSIVDKDGLWVTANFKETQMEDLRLGQEVEIEVDAFPGVALQGKVVSFGGATGAKFSLLPPDNATGNFIKVTQRVPVRIAITGYPKDKSELLLPGLSVFVKVRVK